MERQARMALLCTAALIAAVLPCAVEAKTAAAAKVITPTRVASVDEFVPADGDFSAAYILDARTKKVLYAFKPDMAWPADVPAMASSKVRATAPTWQTRIQHPQCPPGTPCVRVAKPGERSIS